LIETLEIPTPDGPRPVKSTTERVAPASDPWAIATDSSLSRAAKLDRLRRLEFDVRQTLVASEEGMSGKGSLPMLAEVLAAIAHVSPETQRSASPTKS